MTDLFLVNKHNYPKLFEAFELISHDCGRQAGHTNYGIPLEYEKHIIAIEACLNSLNKEEFETLCIGEDLESKAIVDIYGLVNTDKLLQRFFEEFR